MTEVLQGLPPGQVVDQEANRWIEEEPFAAFAHYRELLGDPFTLYRPGKPPRVFLSDPGTIKELLLARDRNLEGCGTSLYGAFIGETALPLLVGEEHRRMRRLITPAVTGPALKKRASAIHGVVLDELRRLRGRPAAPLIDVTSDIAVKIITPVLLPFEKDEEIGRLQRELLAALDAVHHARSLRSAGRAEESGEWMVRFKDHLTAIDVVLFRSIERYRSAPAAGDPSVLARLMESEEGLDDRQIRDQLMTIMIGGSNTVGFSVAMALYWVRRLPAVAERLEAELAALPENASALEIAALPYLGAICDETLRIGSITPTASARKVITPFSALGYEFPAGTELIIAIHLAHRRAESYPDPHDFRPERFLGGGPSPVEYLPFGAGARRCPGSALTELEMRLTLAEMTRTPGLELIGADIPFEPVSHGASMALPPTILTRVVD